MGTVPERRGDMRCIVVSLLLAIQLVLGACATAPELPGTLAEFLARSDTEKWTLLYIYAKENTTYVKESRQLIYGTIVGSIIIDGVLWYFVLPGVIDKGITKALGSQ